MNMFPITHNTAFALNPAYIGLLPGLSPDRYAALKESIVRDGIQAPIIVDENGVVLDGHHRLRIAEELGLRVPSVQISA